MSGVTTTTSWYRRPAAAHAHKTFGAVSVGRGRSAARAGPLSAASGNERGLIDPQDGTV